MNRRASTKKEMLSDDRVDIGLRQTVEAYLSLQVFHAGPTVVIAAPMVDRAESGTLSAFDDTNQGLPDRLAPSLKTGPALKIAGWLAAPVADWLSPECRVNNMLKNIGIWVVIGLVVLTVGAAILTNRAARATPWRIRSSSRNCAAARFPRRALRAANVE